MNVIGIETSGATGSVGAAFEGGASEIVFSEGTSHGRMLAVALRDLLSRLGWQLSDVGLIALGVGPGSYTGLRIAAAFAKSLSYANSIPLVAVSSFDAMAAKAPDHNRPVAPLLDARLGQAYGAAFERSGGCLRRLVPDMVGTPEEVVFAAPEGSLFFGPGVAKFAQVAARRGLCAPPGPWDRPAADEIAKAGARIHAERGPDDPILVRPLYLRKTHAEQKAGGAR